MKLIQPRRFHPIKAGWVLLVLAAFTVYTTHRDQPPRLWRWSGQIMGAGYTVQVVDRRLNEKDFAALTNLVEQALHDLNDELSTWLPDSAISRFNASESLDPFPVSPSTVEITKTALEISELSGGAFDVTFSPLFDLWGFGRSGPKHIPTDDAIAATLTRCGYRNLSLPSPTQIQKAIPGLQVTFNAIAPGYAADVVTALLKKAGHTNTYVDVGGEIVVSGVNQSRKPWRLGIERPDYDAEPGSHVEAVVQFTDAALATSGDYRNYFKDDTGRVFAHIFDPRTARPATTKVASISVIAETGAKADALATTLFVMGPDEGLPWLAERLPTVQALFIMRDSETTFREIATPGFFESTGYRVKEQ